MKMMMAAATIAVLAAGCAKSPDSISPSYISEFSYQPLSCEMLGQEDARLAQALATASSQQEKARSNDIAGVILIGLPVSSLSGDNIAPEIARLKGEREAINRVRLSKGCRIATPVAVASPPRSAPAKSGPPQLR